MPSDQSPEQSPTDNVFSINVTAAAPRGIAPTASGVEALAPLLRQILEAQNRQCKLLEELLQVSQAGQKQRQTELSQWREAHPELAKACKVAVDKLGSVQTEFLKSLTREISDNAESMEDGDFMLYEFVDRFGPRLAQLNGVLQVLAQLSPPT